MTAKTLAYPDYVPEKVRLRATQLRHGEVNDPAHMGWSGVLEGLQTRLDEVERRLRNPDILSEEELATLRREKRDLSAKVGQTKRDLDCLERLTALADPDLNRAYELLNEHLQDDEKIWLFIDAAVAANIEFTGYRDALKSARECKREIATLAEALAEQLKRLEQTGVHTPDVFWSVPALLSSTDASGNNLVLWRLMRGRVLGEHRPDKDPEGASAATPIGGLEENLDEDFPDDEFVVEELEDGAPATNTTEQDNRYAWQVAPSVPDLLETLANVANEFEPREHDMIGSVTAKRQDSEKAAYIRAFAHRLGEYGIDLTTGIKNAMATVATGVLNRPDLLVTYKDVENTLNRSAQ